MEYTLNEIFTDCWGRLFYGSMISNNAFHTGVLGTQLNGELNLRTVVLRAVEPDNKQVIFYTDSRSPKMEAIKAGSALSWLFYDATEKVQLRLSGGVVINQQDEVAERHWEKTGNNGRKSYLAVPAPSTGIAEPADGLEYLIDSGIDLNEGYKNFAVITTNVNFLEWLTLKDDGHRRAQFRLLNGGWKGQWLVP